MPDPLPFSEIDPNEPGMSGVPWDKLLWPPDLAAELLVGAVMDDPAYLGAKLEVLLAMMRDWHSRYNALVDLLQQRDKEFSEKLQELEAREKERVEGLAELHRLREASWPTRQQGV